MGPGKETTLLDFRSAYVTSGPTLKLTHSLSWQKIWRWLQTNFLCYSDKADLGDVAAAKIKQITAELEKSGSNQFDPVDRIKTGFIHFKKEKFEYVFLSNNSKSPFPHFLEMEYAVYMLRGNLGSFHLRYH